MKKLLLFSLIAFIPLLSMIKEPEKIKRSREPAAEAIPERLRKVELFRLIEQAVEALDINKLKLLLSHESIRQFYDSDFANLKLIAEEILEKTSGGPEALKIQSWIQAIVRLRRFTFPQYYFTYPTITRRGDVHPEKLLEVLINAEQDKIYLSFFRFTLPNVADALIALQRRGKEVILIIDNGGKDSDAVQRLIHNGIKVYSPNNLMHTKMVLFFNNVADKQLLWEGSWNCTFNASNLNFETFEISDNEDAFRKYLNYFEYLKSESSLIK